MTEISIDIHGLKVERLLKVHIKGILELMNREGWYYYDRHELERYINLNQDCFVLLKDGRITGSIFTTNYGNQVWIGNIVIAEQLRGFGIATKLIKAVIDYIYRNNHISTFRLGSVPLAIGLYKKVGFHAEAFTTCQEAELPLKLEYQDMNSIGGIRVEKMHLNDLDSISEIDEQYFKSNRLWLLNTLSNDSIKDGCFCLKDHHRTVGFLMVRRRRSSKKEAHLFEGPDYAYRLGPSSILPEYGIEGFKGLFQMAIQAVNEEVSHLGSNAKMYVVFPKNTNKEEIYQETRDLAAAMGLPETLDLDNVFNEHEHIFSTAKSNKNEDQWNYLKSIGFHQEYFEQIMSFTYGEAVNERPFLRTAMKTMADTEGIFASATPGDKA